MIWRRSRLSNWTDELTVLYGSLASHIRDAMQDQIPGADLQLVAFFEESLEVGPTTDQFW